MAEEIDPNTTFEDSFRMSLETALWHKIQTGKEAIQKSRDIIQTQYNAVNEEIRSFQSTASDLATLSGNLSKEKNMAHSSFSKLVSELLGELLAEWDWKWDSEHIRLSASIIAAPPRRSDTPQLDEEEEITALNEDAARTLEEYGYDKILNSINDRQAVRLGKSGYVFEWPPGSGVPCIIRCQQCGFTGNNNPLKIDNAFLVRTHWTGAHPEWRGADYYALFAQIMTAFTFRVEGKTMQDARMHNEAIRRKNEDSKRKRISPQQRRTLTPADSVTNGPASAKNPERSSEGYGKDSITVALPGNTIAAPHPSNNKSKMVGPLALRPSTESSRDIVNSQPVKNIPGVYDLLSSDEEPMMGKRPRWAINID
ncbi:hypothetical protein PG997_014025 [Apiospora hydei]|uniref:Uncharacterized protein n=1 Tax=Apiospora hydei TaxID=1337664 RepID=A0ABR1VBI1_9PEZI